MARAAFWLIGTLTLAAIRMTLIVAAVIVVLALLV
jgi:hypothetical protein